MSIQTFRDSALKTPFGSLDNPVYFNKHGVDRFGVASSKQLYVNVPVDKIFSLGRQDLCEEGKSWRQAVSDLKGEGWEADTVQYFMEPTEDRLFPAPGSYGALELQVAGGLCSCYNGNHRLVAGRALLTEMHLDKAQFQLVKITYSEIDAYTRRFVESAVRLGSPIWTAKVSSTAPRPVAYDIYLQREDQPGVLYARSSIGIVILPKSECFIEKTPDGDFLNSLGGHDRIKTPVDLLSGLIDDDWIISQIADAKTW